MIRLLRVLFPAGRHARGRAERRLFGLLLLAFLVCGGLSLFRLAHLAVRAILPPLPSRAVDSPTAAATTPAPLALLPGSAPADQVVPRLLFAPVVALTAARSEITLAELQARWTGGGSGSLVVSDETASALEALWGPPSPAVQRLESEPAVAEALWEDLSRVALVRFDWLTPAVRVLPLDGRSLLDPTVPNDAWPLAVALDTPLAAAVAGTAAPDWNRRPAALGTVIVSGVTALARSVYTTMLRHGDMAYPARTVAALMAGADLTHISNEVSFKQGCVPDDFAVAFCADPAAMATLEMLGVDVVELTGNHNNDVGAEAALASLDLYRRAGMTTFGGGADARSAARPALLTVRGTTIAFLGYNQFGPDYAWAGERHPGANRWPADPSQLRSDILAARQAGADLVFVHIQHTESYQIAPLPEQRADFRAAVDAGADAVVGTQAHTPQAIEFYHGGPIFYGLGNLIFDQMQSLATRQSLIVRYTVMDGRLLQAELFTTVIEDYAQPRFATPAERQTLLESIFAESQFLQRDFPALSPLRYTQGRP